MSEQKSNNNGASGSTSYTAFGSSSSSNQYYPPNRHYQSTHYSKKKKKNYSPHRNNNHHQQAKNYSQSSPYNNNDNNMNDHHHHHHPYTNHRKSGGAPADMTVICNRVFLFDCVSKKHHSHNDASPQCQHQHLEDHHQYGSIGIPTTPTVDMASNVLAYHFEEHALATATATADASNVTVAIVRVPTVMSQSMNLEPSLEIQNVEKEPWKEQAQAFQSPLKKQQQQQQQPTHSPYSKAQLYIPTENVIDNSIPNPHDSSICHDKYWAQRRRLFWRFDMGIQLDPEGWYSVTPEVIAMHVAERVADYTCSTTTSMNHRNNNHYNNSSGSGGMILLDAFCGCGGNAIAFARQENISMVVCADIDRSKLKKAAYNACLYEIPPEKLVFVECSSLFILQHCYVNGVLSLDHLRRNQQQQAQYQHHPHDGPTDTTIIIPSHVETEVCAGFFIGGIGMLPGRIDAVFMDPPWGGVDYNSLGKNGYCLETHMKIHKGILTSNASNSSPTSKNSNTNQMGDDFFDSFGLAGTSASTCFNQKTDETEYMNGMELLQLAASATGTHYVIYDMPRNTSKVSLARCAYAAGYRGNLKLEEHYLNGRLKTVTAYMGADFRSMLL